MNFSAISLAFGILVVSASARHVVTTFDIQVEDIHVQESFDVDQLGYAVKECLKQKDNYAAFKGCFLGTI